MKSFFASFFSMLTSVLLVVILGVAIAYATFLENDYGTITARVLVYDAWWFELIMALLCVNMIGSAFQYKLVSRKKWAVLLFHLAFIVMIAGAGITRYFSFEGSMHIREGNSSDVIITDAMYVTVKAESASEQVKIDEKVVFSPYASNRFSKTINIAGKTLEVKNVDFVPQATETMVQDEFGSPAVSFMVVGPDFSRKDFILSSGQQKNIGGALVSFNDGQVSSGLRLKYSGEELLFQSEDTVWVLNMMGGAEEILLPGQEHRLADKTIYRSSNIRFVLKAFYPKAKLSLIHVPQHENNELQDALTVEVKQGDEVRELHVFGQKGEIGEPSECVVDGIKVNVSYGSLEHKLPFAIRLDDFQLERYPGSHSPSSFASEVKILENEVNEGTPFRIFMNNILNYKGYRFFQSSYDEDEKGTILSVSYDWWGTAVSYLGYFLLTVGMLFTLFSRNSRFMFLVRASSKLKQLRLKSGMVLLLGVLLAGNAVAATSTSRIGNTQVTAFGEFLVQDKQGRIEPVSTLASEVLRKLSKRNTYQGMSATEVFLLMNAFPEHWRNQPVIKVSNDELKKLLGITSDIFSFNELVGQEGERARILNEMVNEAYQKKPTQRNKLDKEVINVDERMNICFSVFQGDFLKSYPVPNDANNTWVTPKQFLASYDSIGSEIEQISLQKYFAEVALATESGDWSASDKLLENIKNYQREFGAAIVPPVSKVRMEIFYNEQNIFGKLSYACLILGLVLLLLHFYHIFNPSARLGKILFSATYLVFVVFLVYSIGLAIRWYISGHAPWSNGYETMLYIGWASLLSGFIFVKRSPVTLSVTTVLAGLSLMVAGMSWLNPEITNLVPVLKSYWLIVHVAIITASYGFLAISALLGLMNLILMIMRTEKNIRTLTYSITELAYIIEMSLIIGLMLLTVGSFIGAVWANESWGRYWGWDPKESWALVTILVYTFILHLKKIPGLKSHLVLSACTLVGYSSVLMTFFGVNYYLSGMHSYAQGDPPPVPVAVYWSILLIVVVIVFAIISEKKFGGKVQLEELDAE